MSFDLHGFLGTTSIGRRSRIILTEVSIEGRRFVQIRLYRVDHEGTLRGQRSHINVPASEFGEFVGVAQGARLMLQEGNASE